MQSTRKGVSLVELIIAMAVFVIIGAAFGKSLLTLVKADTQVTLQFKANQKLRSIADEIRYQAFADFDTITETAADRTGTTDPKIKVTSTITEIDPVRRTRLVTLLATWKEGIHEKSMTSSFTLTHVRGEKPGAAIRIKVVQRGTSNGVDGVKITAPGQISPLVECVPAGFCRVSRPGRMDSATEMDMETSALYFSEAIKARMVEDSHFMDA